MHVKTPLMDYFWTSGKDLGLEGNLLCVVKDHYNDIPAASYQYPTGSRKQFTKHYCKEAQEVFALSEEGCIG